MLSSLRGAFAHVDEGLYRAKGFVLTDGGWVYLDWSAGALDVQPARAPGAVSALVVIWNPALPARTLNALRALRG